MKQFRVEEFHEHGCTVRAATRADIAEELGVTERELEVWLRMRGVVKGLFARASEKARET